VATGPTRDDEHLMRGLGSWMAHAFPDRPDARITSLTRPSTGWSNETVVVSAAWCGGAGELVVRLPPLLPSFPSYELADQAVVLGALGAAGVPVPAAIAVEDDPDWLGAPFLVMSFVAGRTVGDAPARDAWLAGAPARTRRRVHEEFIGMLARVHRVDWRTPGLDGRLRGGVRAEISYWQDYVRWAARDDIPAHALVDALAWCARSAPDDAGASLLWGDARLGNVMYDDDGRALALLDWELATIGPPEMDLAWYLSLDSLTTHYTGRTVPDFLARDDVIELYEAELGRPVRDLAWHEIFALARSISINDCQARVAARAGAKYPGIAGDENPILAHLTDRIDEYPY